MKRLRVRILSPAILGFFAAVAPLARAEEKGTDGSEEAAQGLKAGDRDPEFLLRVNECVRKGAEQLLGTVQEDGSFESSKGGLNGVSYSKGFPGGVTALVLLAMLKSGVNRHDERIVKGFEWLKQEQLAGEKYDPNVYGTIYVAAVTLMALEARNEPPAPPGKPKELTSSAPAARMKLPPADAAWMLRLSRFIEVSILPSVRNPPSPGSTSPDLGPPDAWNYPGGVPTADARNGSIRDGNRLPDHSNTQYALLGLKAAHRCGIPFDAETFKAMANVAAQFVRTQEAPDSSRRKVPRLTILEDKAHGYVSYKTQSQVLDEPRGWKYMASDSGAGSAWQTEVTGSMTTAGIAGLLIAASIARERGALPPALLEDVRKATWDGLAWLDANFTVDKNPGASDPGWHYYYLYGLERAGVLAGVRNMGKHDWYREGAERLISAQARDGSWQGDAVPACFALLFLTRATVPMGGVVTR
jgi:hypothetical protein